MEETTKDEIRKLNQLYTGMQDVQLKKCDRHASIKVGKRIRSSTFKYSSINKNRNIHFLMPHCNPSNVRLRNFRTNIPRDLIHKVTLTIGHNEIEVVREDMFLVMYKLYSMITPVNDNGDGDVYTTLPLYLSLGGISPCEMKYHDVTFIVELNQNSDNIHGDQLDSFHMQADVFEELQNRESEEKEKKGEIMECVCRPSQVPGYTVFQLQEMCIYTTTKSVTKYKLICLSHPVFYFLVNRDINTLDLQLKDGGFEEMGNHRLVLKTTGTVGMWNIFRVASDLNDIEHIEITEKNK